ncbi:MAG TPA: hypothetical protein PKO06_11215, partial [Candidatus Ozemobacteraceae bacterium]|nr:hypothetical protein [Candidatus Ozemobacteraceae bacterium]
GMSLNLIGDQRDLPPTDPVKPLAKTIVSGTKNGLTFEVTGWEDRPATSSGVSNSDTFTMRVIELAISSKEATHLLAADSAIRLHLPTSCGDLAVPLSPLTRSIPYGWRGSAQLVPNEKSRVRLVFLLPTAIAGRISGTVSWRTSDLDALLPLGDKAPDHAPPAHTARGNGFECRINRVFHKAEEPNPLYVDVTVKRNLDGTVGVFEPGLLAKIEGESIELSAQSGNRLFSFGPTRHLEPGEEVRGLYIFEAEGDKVSLVSDLLRLDWPTPVTLLPADEEWLTHDRPEYPEEKSPDLEDGRIRSLARQAAGTKQQPPPQK